jgi:hypothetical protein
MEGSMVGMNDEAETTGVPVRSEFEPITFFEWVRGTAAVAAVLLGMIGLCAAAVYGLYLIARAAS